MKKRRVLVCLVVVSMLLAATTAGAQAIREPWSGSESEPEILYPGDVTSAGDTTHIRGMVELTYLDASDARVKGYNRVVANLNLNAQGYGTVWGTNRLDVDGMDGYWEGTFQGKIDATGISLRTQGRGFGDVDGLLLVATMENYVMEGVILETPKP